MYKIKEPSQKISPRAIKVWRIVDGLNILFFLGVLIFLKFLHHNYKWSPWIEVIIYSLIGILLVSAVIEIIFLPLYKQKNWRYEISNNCIQLKRGGAIKKSHLIIPMNKVYYVDTYQGLILQRYKLSTVRIGTIGYIHEIPGIPENEAQELRNTIAMLSGIDGNSIKMEEIHGQ